ncbi:hypothetical protein Q4485_03215 [Granulosicoccaceae sp. 1_MG-2023]|nr:hypothetical protein [Granulosicoccaceae sp. 1_MG-2023]
MFKLIASIPLFAYLLIAFNLIAFGGSEDPLAVLNRVIYDVDLPSTAHLAITVSHAFILAGIVILYIEIFKSTRPSAYAIVDHGLSMLVFVIFLVEFITVKQVGNSAFLILTLLTLTDVIAGFTVSISTARRDISLQ